MKAITQQLKRLTDDERAVSPVVGFVLMFALIMIVFTIYQAEVVPAQNAEVEFKHSQAVEGEISQLNDAIQQTGANGVPQSATIATGVQYPDRALAINPGAPAGTLETSDPQTVTISGLSDGSGYWSVGRTFDTHLVSYQSNYNILQQETAFILENGMIVKHYQPDSPSGNIGLKSNGGVITDEGRRINLVLVGGDYTQSAIATSTTVRPVSTSTEYLQVQTESSGGDISIPTTLPRSTWEDMLGNTYTAGTPNVKLNGHTNGDPGTVKIGLQGGETFALRITKVNLGGSGESELTYLKSEDSTTNPTIDADTPKTLTVSAHDEFGNPAVGETVEATVVSGSGTFASGSDTATASTGDGGRAVFRYEPGDADAGTTVEIKLTLVGGDTTTATLPDGSTKQLNTVIYELDVLADSSDADSGGIDNGYPIGIVLEDVRTPDDTTIELDFSNTRPGDVTVTNVRVNGILRQGANAVLSDITIVDTTNTDISVNGGLESLNAPFSIPADGTATMTIKTLDGDDPNTNRDSFNKGGFLIMYIEFTTPEGTVSDTYFVGVSSS